MEMEHYIKFQNISLKKHPEINEKWVQKKIEEDPSILGLGDGLTLRQSEKIQQSGGRLDMLLHDDDSNTRYTIELQLGKTDETHIIRTIEYWDIERKRNQNYNYVAVIIAEEITNRFFNVISLFNGSIPLIAIQLNAIKCDKCNSIALVFTTILDLISPDEEEEIGEPVDRAYWEKRGSKDTVKMVDKLHGFIAEFVNGFTIKYNKHHIGLTQNDVARNFVAFKPQKSVLVLHIRLNKSEEIDKIINNSDLDQLAYDKQFRQYRLRLKQEDLAKSKDVIVDLMKKAYTSFTGNGIDGFPNNE